MMVFVCRWLLFRAGRKVRFDCINKLPRLNLIIIKLTIRRFQHSGMRLFLWIGEWEVKITAGV
jgi:hypothetical protein